MALIIMGSVELSHGDSERQAYLIRIAYLLQHHPRRLCVHFLLWNDARKPYDV